MDGGDFRQNARLLRRSAKIRDASLEDLPCFGLFKRTVIELWNNSFKRWASAAQTAAGVTGRAARRFAAVALRAAGG